MNRFIQKLEKSIKKSKEEKVRKEKIRIEKEKRKHEKKQRIEQTYYPEKQR